MSEAMTPDEVETFPLAFVVEKTGVPSEDWLRRRLNARQIPGRRAGREWRMTLSDMAALVEYMATGPSRPVTTDSTGLTPASRRRLERRRTH
ncbi:hypothetical protein [Nocardia transvalensis]|uniref:hypothetical protein n=1 Tax=Nocardia transvalensis TaxID=37333 RepID=UPI0018944009|nr:hypothetical protein [Nocardia transvalensis]MBF6328762.1 hypothetical protein [Nocardia transvalensis]